MFYFFPVKVLQSRRVPQQNVDERSRDPVAELHDLRRRKPGPDPRLHADRVPANAHQAEGAGITFKDETKENPAGTAPGRHHSNAGDKVYWQAAQRLRLPALGRWTRENTLQPESHVELDCEAQRECYEPRVDYPRPPVAGETSTIIIQ